MATGILWAILAAAALLGWLGRRFLPRGVRAWLGGLLVAIGLGLFGYSYVASKIPKWILADIPVKLAANENYALKLQPNRSGEYHLELDYAKNYMDTENGKLPDPSLDLKWSFATANGAELKSGRETPVACGWSQGRTMLCLPSASFTVKAGETYLLKVAVKTPSSRETVAKRLKVSASDKDFKDAFVFATLAVLISLPLLLAGLILLPLRLPGIAKR